MFGLFGGSKSETTFPPYITDNSKQLLEMANARNDVGFVPYYGPQVAAFTPMQEASFNGVSQAARAFGLPNAPSSVPTPTDFGGGLMGYSGAPVMNDALARLEQADPELYGALMALRQRNIAEAANPAAGGPATYEPQGDLSGYAANMQPSNNSVRGSGGGGGFSFGGYNGLGDMIDGGGPGASGGSYSGGGLVSAIANMVGSLK